MTDLLPLFLAPAEVAALDPQQVSRVDVGAEELFVESHLPGAVRADFSWLVRKVGDAGGLMPDPHALAGHLAGLGLRDDRPMVVYDRDGGGRACRLVWCLHVMGYTLASVLDGGLAAWQADGFDVEAGAAAQASAPGRFEVRMDTTRLIELPAVLAALGDPEVQLLDTRSAGEFAGTDVRARRGGHIPGAVHWDWVNALDADRERRLRPPADLRAQLESLGLRRDARIVAYCQTHHRSSHTYVLLRHLGFERACGYAGAWSEWGNDDSTPIA